ncbi:hypothetical protein QQP08_001642 [Theobroma cacao]|nr:hypothetical protein QQP08_001642 [Theobroma cacao]
MKTYFNILNSSATGKASVPNKSTIKADGRDFIAAIAERRPGKDSRIMTTILVTMCAPGSTLVEISADGRETMLRTSICQDKDCDSEVMVGNQALAKLEHRDQVAQTRACQEGYVGFCGLHDDI